MPSPSNHANVDVGKAGTPKSIYATVKDGSPAEVQVEEQSLDALPATVTLRP